MAAGNKKSYKNNTSKNGTSKNAASKKTVAKNSSKGGSNNMTSAKKNTASKKTSARSKAAIERKAREEELARQKQMRSEIILIVLFAFSVFLLLANFRICGIVGDTVSGFFFGIIGFSEYIFPVYLFVSAAYLISNDFRRKIVKKVIYFCVVLILLSMVFQAIYSSTFESVKVLYMDGYKDRSGGGVICGGIFFAIRTLLGVPGACIVIFIAAVIMFILITEISVIDEIKLFIASIRERRESDDDEQYEDEEYQSDRYDDGYYSHDVNDTPVRRVRPSMANLNVYSSDKSKDDRASDRTAATQVKPRKTKTQKDVEREPARDFFAMEDVHELTPGDGAVDMSYDEFNNDIEKIVMTDREEIVNPVQIDREDPVHKPVRKPAPVKRRKPVVVTPEEPKLAAVDTDMEDAEILSFTDDAEDVLAGAVNGNMHPESVSDYNPLYDSAFAEEEKTDTAAQSKKKPAVQTESSKQYQEGRKYKFPTADLLSQPKKTNNSNRDAHVRETAIKLKNTLETFGVNVTITNYSCGPAVTRFEMQPEQGVKVSKILNLADDIKLNLAAADIRIEAPIPGKAAIGIEVPNKENSIVAFRELIESDNFKNLKSKVAFAVGKDISGQVIATDIAKMPHLLIAGATGSGKSVCINTLIMSILYKATPEEVKLIMIDPKMVELACYNGIPHLLIPVVTDPKKAAGALNWAVMEMTRRYQLFAEHSVRNIQGYNDKVENAVIAGADGEKLTKMPQIVVIVDELADLMMVAHGEVEDAIVRLSQLARAAGIHLVIATQRPSVDVITGLIKANVPSRIAFAVSSGVDSRTILDMVGAEKLLGKGDMLFYPTGYPKPVRVQGAFVSDDEVTAVVDFLKKNNGVGTYDEEISKSISGNGGSGATAIGGASASDKDEYFVEAGRFIIEKEKASIGMLQRTFKIGFNRAARIMDQLMAAGVVGPEEGTKARKILMTQEQFDEYIDTNL